MRIRMLIESEAILLLLLAVLIPLSNSADDGSKLTYMRVPKSGSTSAMEKLRACGITIVDHGNGCMKPGLQNCNGSHHGLLGHKTFAVLREPTSRFRSVEAHLQRIAAHSKKHESAWARLRFGNAISCARENISCPLNLLSFLDNITRGCFGDMDCSVNRINRRMAGTYIEPARVILWPQSFYISHDTRYPSQIICYDSDHLNDNINVFLKSNNVCGGAALTLKHLNVLKYNKSEINGETSIAHIKALFPTDFELWRKHCADPAALGDHGKSTKEKILSGALPSTVTGIDIAPTRSLLAVLLAGQIRKLHDKIVQAMLHERVIAGTNATVFAHLNPEFTIATWKPYHNGTNASLDMLDREIGDFKKSFVGLFNPAFLMIKTDSNTMLEPGWRGNLLGDSEAQSIVFFRFYALYNELVKYEAKIGARFLFVLKMRPDVLPKCVMHTLKDLPRFLNQYSAISSHDLACLMRRESASIALSAYLRANRVPNCGLKVEMCVKTMLVEATGLLGEAHFVSIIRNDWECIRNRKKGDPGMICGHELLHNRHLAECSVAFPSPRHYSNSLLEKEGKLWTKKQGERKEKSGRER